MFHLMAAKGLGDALYMRAIAIHLIASGEAVTVFTMWPDAFLGIDVAVKPLGARTGAEDIRHCNFCLHCRLPEVQMGGMFEMACRQAGILEPVELKAGWAIRNKPLVDKVRRAAGGRPIMVYQPLKPAAGVEQRLVQPLLGPYADYIESRSDHFRVKLGLGGDGACEMDLTGKTSICDAMDVAAAADFIFGEPCYLTTLAQAMDKTYGCMFSRRAQSAIQSRVRNLTPERFMAKPGTVVYDQH
jgi:hypothetical protein